MRYLILSGIGVYMKTLPEWLAQLEKQASRGTIWEQRQRIQKAAEKWQILAPARRVILVGGTNGKGSCVALLEAIYREAGYRVGTFTSPHLLQFNERIRLLGQNANDESILNAFRRIAQEPDAHHYSYFQYAFLAALLLFQDAALDVAILEIGIGGRYDVVNLVTPDLSIISSIDLDHCEILGDTREAIATDKAGIMRRHKPIICGDLDPPVTLFQEAQKKEAILYCLNRDFRFTTTKHGWSFQSQEKTWTHLPLSIILLQNAATVLAAVTCLQSYLPVSDESVESGLKKLELKGRLQKLQFRGIPVLADVAHNPAALAQLKKSVDEQKGVRQKRIVCGMCRDKDVAQNLAIIRTMGEVFYVAKLNNSRSADPVSLVQQLKQRGATSVSCFDQVSLAFECACQEASINDMIIACGSFWVVSDVLKIIEQEK
jgi:dihydrofolate synthase/folylpolyglutamate synthase